MDMTIRPRRLRGNDTLRRMVRETRMDKSSLIYPMFVKEGNEHPGGDPVHGLDSTVTVWTCMGFEPGAGCQDAGVKNVMFFGIPDHKDEVGSGAYDREWHCAESTSAKQKKEFPELYLITDVCMCEYTIPRTLRHACADTMWTMIGRWSCLQRPLFPMWKPEQIW